MPPPYERKPVGPGAGLLALFLSVLWSGNPIAIKIGLDYAPPLRLGWMRFVAGAVVILIWAIYTRADLRVRRGEYTPLLVLGVLFTVQLAFMNIGLEFTTAGHSIVLTVTFPIWVALLSHFFIAGDRLVPSRFAGVVLAYAGVVVIFLDSLETRATTEIIIGDIFAAISGFLLGVRQVYSARLSQGIDPNKMLLTQAAFGTIAFVIAGTIFEPEPYIWAWGLAAAVAYQGFVIAGLGFIAQLWLIQRYLPSQVTVIALTQPMFGIVLAWLILGEPITVFLFAGGVLVMIGAGLAQRRARAEKEAASTAASAPTASR